MSIRVPRPWLYRALAAAGALLWLALGATLAWTYWALETGRATVSGYLKAAPRWVVAAVGFWAGLVVGVLFSHWWFPTVGGGSP